MPTCYMDEHPKSHILVSLLPIVMKNENFGLMQDQGLLSPGIDVCTNLPAITCILSPDFAFF